MVPSLPAAAPRQVRRSRARYARAGAVHGGAGDPARPEAVRGPGERAGGTALAVAAGAIGRLRPDQAHDGTPREPRTAGPPTDSRTPRAPGLDVPRPTSPRPPYRRPATTHPPARLAHNPSTRRPARPPRPIGASIGRPVHEARAPSARPSMTPWLRSCQRVAALALLRCGCRGRGSTSPRRSETPRRGTGWPARRGAPPGCRAPFPA